MKAIIKITNLETIHEYLKAVDASGVIDYALENSGPKIEIFVDGHKQRDFKSVLDELASTQRDDLLINLVYTPIWGASKVEVKVEGDRVKDEFVLTAVFEGTRGSIMESGVGVFFWPLVRWVEDHQIKANLVEYQTSDRGRGLTESKEAYLLRQSGMSLEEAQKEIDEAYAAAKRGQSLRALELAFPGFLAQKAYKRYAA